MDRPSGPGAARSSRSPSGRRRARRPRTRCGPGSARRPARAPESTTSRLTVRSPVQRRCRVAWESPGIREPRRPGQAVEGEHPGDGGIAAEDRIRGHRPRSCVERTEQRRGGRAGHRRPRCPRGPRCRLDHGEPPVEAVPLRSSGSSDVLAVRAVADVDARPARGASFAEQHRRARRRSAGARRACAPRLVSGSVDLGDRDGRRRRRRRAPRRHRDPDVVHRRSRERHQQLPVVRHGVDPSGRRRRRPPPGARWRCRRCRGRRPAGRRRRRPGEVDVEPLARSGGSNGTDRQAVSGRPSKAAAGPRLGTHRSEDVGVALGTWRRVTSSTARKSASAGRTVGAPGVVVGRSVLR